MKTVAISSIGSTGGINILKMLREQKDYQVRVLGLDASPDQAGRYLADVFHRLPQGDDPNYIEELLGILEKEEVDLFIPVMEKEVEKVAEARREGKGIPAFLPDLEQVRLCHDKKALSRTLKKIGVYVPKSLSEDSLGGFPFLLKERTGGGGKGVFKISDHEDWKKALANASKSAFYQEFIEGDEYSVDGYIGSNGDWIGAVPRSRSSVKNGLAVRSETVESPELIDEVKRIVNHLELRGPFNVQAKRKESTFYFFDVNLRFGGGSILSMKAGLRGPLYMLNELEEDPIEYSGYQPLRMYRYWQEVFVDGADPLL